MIEDILQGVDSLPTWKGCRLVVENYEYSTSHGVTGVEYVTPPTSLQSFIYENEPWDSKEAEVFRFALIAGMNLESNRCQNKWDSSTANHNEN